jgi:hypothetical protein
MNYGHLSLLFLFCILFVPVQAGSPDAYPDDDLTMVLLKVANALEDRLERLDLATMNASQALFGNLSNEKAGMIMAELKESDPSITSASVIDLTGTILISASEYETSVGSQVDTTTPAWTTVLSGKPVLSELFRSVEGADHMVYVGYPVFGPDGKVIGVVTALFSPVEFVRRATDEIISGSRSHLMVTQPDTAIIYEEDGNQIGKTANDEIFSGYEDLKALAVKTGVDVTGYGTYTYPDSSGTPLQKETLWTTIMQHGAEWRVSVIQPVGHETTGDA